MGKKNPSAKHDKQNGETVNKSNTSVMPINWEEVVRLCSSDTIIPENAITVVSITENMNILRSSAQTKMKRLEASGLFTSHLAKRGSSRVKYLLRKADK